jgi:histidyl-tRNA synthetase
MASAAQKPLIAGGVGAAPNVDDIFRVAVLGQAVALDPAGSERVKKDSPPPKAFSPEEPSSSSSSAAPPTNAVLSREETRAVIAARLLTVMNGRSGVRLQVAERLAAMLNGGAPLPVLPAPPLAGDDDDGAAAASSAPSSDDNAATLSALADALKGEGFELGTNAPLSPADPSSPGIGAAERAALCGGGAAAAGVGALAVHGGRRLLAAATAVAALSCEAFGAPVKASLEADALEALGVKSAQAQADQLRGLLDGSRLANTNRSAGGITAARLFASLPQRLGAAQDGLAAAYAAVRPAVQAGALPPVAVKQAAVAAAAAPAPPAYAPAAEPSPTLASALLEAARALLAVGAGALSRARALDPQAFTAAADGEEGPQQLLASPAVAEATAALDAATRRAARVGAAMLADPLAAPSLAAATAANEALAAANHAVAVEALAAVVALRRQEGGASVSAATAAMATLQSGGVGGEGGGEGGGGGANGKGGKKKDKKSGGGGGGAAARGLALGKGTALVRAYLESAVARAARGGPVVTEAPGAAGPTAAAAAEGQQEHDDDPMLPGHSTAETSTLPVPPADDAPPVVRDVGAALAAAQRALSPSSAMLTRMLDDTRQVAEANAARRKPKIAKGARDFAPEQMAVRDAAFAAVTRVFKRHGAVAIDTPVFELRETLTGKYGEDSKLIYDLADQGGEALSLRYDLTVPFARYCAVTGTTAIRRYHVGKVYRRDQPAMNRGRFREFFQCDFDVAGAYSAMAPDAEVLKVLTEILDDLKLGDYVIKLNHRGLLDACLAVSGVPASKTRAICSAVDKLDKEPWTEVRREMVEDKGLAEEAADAIGRLVVLKGEPRALLAQLTGGGGGGEGGGDTAHLAALAAHPSAAAALADLALLFEYLEAMGGGALQRVSFDLSLARGLDYYTGVIYEAVLRTDDGAHVGSIAAGGRYDGLVGMFSGKDVPAVGVSIGIERVFAILEARTRERREAAKARVTAAAAASGQASASAAADDEATVAAAELAALPRATQTEVLVASIGSGLMPRRMALAAQLWAKGVAAEFGYKPNPKMGDQISAALDQGIPLMAIFGEDEISSGTVKLKDMARKTEDVVKAEDLAAEVLLRRRREEE